MLIILQGNAKSTQAIYRSACRGKFPTMYMTREGKAIKEAYQLEARVQWRDAPLEGDICMKINFYFGDKQRRDLDNQNKLVLDSLTGIAYHDDKQIAELHLSRHYEKGQGRTEILIYPQVESQLP